MPWESSGQSGRLQWSAAAHQNYPSFRKRRGIRARSLSGMPKRHAQVALSDLTIDLEVCAVVRPPSAAEGEVSEVILQRRPA